MTTPVAYGDLSPRTAAHAVANMLKRGLPILVLEKFGQVYTIPTGGSKTAKWRRYNALPLATNPLVEGVTPAGSKVTVTDVTATLDQYGDFVPFTDVVLDTIEDPFLQQLQMVLGEQAAQTVETLRWNVLKAGTNVQYSNGTQRTDVNTPITLAMQRKATRTLKRQNASHFTNIVKSTPNYATQSVAASFVGVVHVDCENDIRAMAGFIDPKNYGTTSPWENEIGSVEDVRYIRSTVFTPFPDAGGAKGAMLSTTGTLADVYPVLYLSRDAYAIVPLKGKDALSIAVVNPKPVIGDPLGQKGTAGWKTMQTCVILNDAWIVRGECAATA